MKESAMETDEGAVYRRDLWRFLWSNEWILPENMERWRRDSPPLRDKFLATANMQYAEQLAELQQNCMGWNISQSTGESASKLEWSENLLSVTYLRGIDVLHANYKLYKNPVYVWQALELKQQLMSYNKDFDCPIPSWCTAYLLDCSAKILSIGQIHNTVFHLEKTASKEKGAKKANKLAVSPSKLVSALGLKRKGWSAFSSYLSERAEQHDLFWFNMLKDWGKRPPEALDIILAEKGQSDDRSLRRRLAKAKRGKGRTSP